MEVFGQVAASAAAHGCRDAIRVLCYRNWRESLLCHHSCQTTDRNFFDLTIGQSKDAICLIY